MTGKTLLVLVFITLFIMGSHFLVGERGDDTNRLSKNGKITGKIGNTAVVIEYGRPKVGGRTIWGGLVPYDQIWRTGADEATTISFSNDVQIDGHKLPAGIYSLFTIPGLEEWTVIFNKVSDQWGPYQYDKAQDALRINVKPETSDMIEELTFQILATKVVLNWEKLSIAFSVNEVQ